MRFSDFEVEVLQIFWERGDLTAPEVHKAIESKRKVAYNTVKTIIDRLEKKGALVRVRQYGRTILFRAFLGREEVTRPMVHGFLDRIFKGDRKALMSHLIQDEELTSEDVSYIENLLKKAKSRKEP